MDGQAQSHAARMAGEAAFAVTLNRLPLLIATILLFVLFDFVIEGSMREAMRAMILDAPHQLFLLTAVVLLACGALRFTGEAMAVLVASDLFQGSGTGPFLTRWLPRLAAVTAGAAAGLPMLRLAVENVMYSGTVLGLEPVLFGLSPTILAGVFGALYVCIGLFGCFWGRGFSRSEYHRDEGGSRYTFLRLALALPLLVATVALLLGAWFSFLDADFLKAGIARYQPLDIGRLAIDLGGFVVAGLVIRFAGQVLIALPLNVFAGMDARNSRISALVMALVVLSIGMYVAANFAGFFQEATPLTKTTRGFAFAIEEGNLRIIVGVLYAVAAIAGSLLGIGFSGRHDWASIFFDRAVNGWIDARQNLAELNSMWRMVFITFVTIATAVLIITFSALSGWASTFAGTVAVIFTWAFVAAIVFFPLAYLSHTSRVPFLAILALAGLTFSALDMNDNHKMRSEEASGKPYRRYLETVDFARWLETRGDLDAYLDAGKPYPVFIVATEGGGIRAAYYTAQVLAALQDICPGFAQHTYAISGVSGGSLGAAVFAGLTADFVKETEFKPCDFELLRAEATSDKPTSPADKKPVLLVDRARKILKGDLLSPLLGSALFPDAFQRIWPVSIPRFDRALALEAAFENGWNNNCGPECKLGRMGQPIDELFKDDGNPDAVPHLILNATEVESGLSLPVSTLNLKFKIGEPTRMEQKIASQAASTNPDQEIQYRCKVEKERNLPSRILQDELNRDVNGEVTSYARIPLSTAAFVSARFPYLTPAARIEGLKCGTRRFVDGGYFENSGTWIVNDLIKVFLTQQIGAGGTDARIAKALKTAQVYALVIRSTPPCTRIDQDGKTCKEDEDQTTGAWSEILSPFRALMATRSARADIAKQDLIAEAKLIAQIQQSAAPTVNALCRDAGPADAANGPDLCKAAARPAPEVVILGFHNKRGTEIPLTWLLSRQARAPIDSAIENMIERKEGDTGGDGESNAIGGPVRQLLCALNAPVTHPSCAAQ